MAVRKAIVLAAGFGTRLRPLTVARPKPLLPIMGEPMLARVLDMLVSWGVEDIKVNAHCHADQIERFVSEYCGAGESGGGIRKGVSITVSREDAILGTGGALRPLEGWIGDEPFWLVNGDIVVEDLDPEPIEEAFERSGRFASCWMSEDFGPRTVEADREGRICNWKSDDAGYPGTYTYCGVALLSPDVLRHLPPPRPAEGVNGEGFCSVVDAYENAMMNDAKFVVGVQEPEACWCDAGTVATFRELNSGTMAPSLFGDRRLDAVVAALGWKDESTLAEFLDARGSDRMLYRLYREGASDSALAVVYENVRKENANTRFAPLTRFLDGCGVRVPKLLADLPDSNAYATEYVDGRSLEALANEKGTDVVRLYIPAVEMLKSLWKVASAGKSLPELEPPFDAALFAWERNLFERECLIGRYGMEGIPDDVRGELEGVAAALADEPQTLVHRDFQSANLLYRASDLQHPYMIDYQGMRLGPAAYDVASLLYDPYVRMDASDRRLLAGVAANATGAPSERSIALAAVQRLCQALGAYCRLVSAGQPQFAKYVSRAAENLHHAAHEAGLNATAEFSHRLVELSGGHAHASSCRCGSV